jgi:hypothetical protein
MSKLGLAKPHNGISLALQQLIKTAHMLRNTLKGGRVTTRRWLTTRAKMKQAAENTQKQSKPRMRGGENDGKRATKKTRRKETNVMTTEKKTGEGEAGRPMGW